MKTERSATMTKAVLSTFTALILFAPPILTVSPLTSSASTSLNLSTLPVFEPPNFGGVITNAGSQEYTIAGGVAVADGYIFSTPIPAGTPVNFRLSASVVGLTTSGSGQLGLSTGNGTSGGNLQGVSFRIASEVQAATFPLGSSNPNSQIPFFFVGMATAMGQSNQSSPMSVPVMIESAYWNPFGGPIVISSVDNGTSIFLVLTYSTATIQWTGTQVDGALAGTYGSMPVAGGYTTVTNSFENLLAGSEQDSGQISFYGFGVPQINANGKLSGSTYFTAVGGQDCSTSTGVPGTCLLTGASSSGSFGMHTSQGGRILGSYSTVWSVPSTFTATTLNALVTQH